ncbi:CidA/LrgA family protein [Halalkalibacterium halodurans]|uniref:Murein hydrolase transporter LrgA n=1 Tax=Halalkalibacterium halodurans TaxID=86665 RepID=A0A0M0KGT9_ALKHA|nr:CidA/LrgA family protein [Halalkalibacterium halodurans]TPE67218.1 CidA/LrgA family protein [Halalkalibacterium halodurans]
MRLVHILLQVGILYGFYLVGSWIQKSFELIVPGSIIGMVLLLIALAIKAISPKWIEQGSMQLLLLMPMLFLPVTVGIMEYWHMFHGSGFWLLIIAFVSTILVFIISGWITQWLIVWKTKGIDKHDHL